MDTLTDKAKKLATELNLDYHNILDDLKNGATVNEIREFYQPHDLNNSYHNGLAYL